MENTIQMEVKENEKYQKLINAFGDSKFQQEINEYRYSIEQELGNFLEWLLHDLKPQQMIFRSPESRIKSKSGFSEKISRKDYIHKWNIDDDIRHIQDEILMKLPDLIGFRITCFFMEDEKIIYDRLKIYHDENQFKNIQLNFTEGTEQKNGHKIYKVSGVYQNKASFELQVKAAVHNVWGEVEHKTIYKGSQFAVDLKQRQTITNEVFNILRASDRQLLSLFTHQYTEQDLICGLFAEKTRQNVVKASGTEYLAGHYNSFFDIFLKVEWDNILSYVSKSLSETPYEKKSVDVQHDDSTLTNFADDIKDRFLEYYLQVQYNIAQELYYFKDYDEFILYLASVMKTYLTKDEDELEEIENDAFSNIEEFEDDGELHIGESELLLNLLKDKLPDALKEGK